MKLVVKPLLCSILLLILSNSCTNQEAQNISILAPNQAAHINHLSEQSAIYLSKGEISQAISMLNEALYLAKQHQNPDQLTTIYGQLSDAYLLQKQAQVSIKFAQYALAQAWQTKNLDSQANSLNYLANSQVALGDFSKAEMTYNDAINLLENENLPALQLTLLINLSHLYLAQNQPKLAAASLPDALLLLKALPATEQTVNDLIAVGYITLQLNSLTNIQKPALTQSAFAVLNEALALSETLNFGMGLSYSNGHLAELYLSTKQTHVAETLLHRALFFAEQSSRPELISRWLWQLAKIKQSQGQTIQAKQYYQLALQQLGAIQPALLYGHRGGLNTPIKPQIFQDFIGLLLNEAEKTPNTQQQQALLLEVRDLIEKANSNELTHYFQDECVAAQRQKNASLSLDDQIQPGTALLYTLIYPDHLVLLINLANGEIKQFNIPVNLSQLSMVVSSFRREISAYGNPRKIRQHGEQLYNWLIKPIHQTLTQAAVKTLVVTPTGILRTLPYAALFDGQQFLINAFALTITPGLELTSPSSAPSFAFDNRVLLNGLSESVAGFSALPYVKEEISRIEPIFNSTLLLNEDFRYSDIKQKLQENTYSAIVFATHSQFKHNVNQSYLLSYDGKINLNQLDTLIKLNQFREPAIDLLVLSACETAIGDEQAALGMAGAAVKSGAASVLASLWLANDASTATLIPDFFEQLKSHPISKAQALQNAQMAMLKQGPYQHPFHWAGFMLIGNWL